MNTWNLRTEILSAAHRWYWVVFSFLLGALMGWLVSMVWPGPYRAVQDIYVGLNAHRATRDLYLADVGIEQFRNLDDYKNWQMEQLNSLALSDEFLRKTLTRLQVGDESWKEVDVQGLRKMLEISWRNTGDWHFSAEATSQEQASQAVTEWTRVVAEEVNLAADAARHLIEIDTQMQAISDELVELSTRQLLLQDTLVALDRWQKLLINDQTNEPLSPSDHWALLSQVTSAMTWNIGWRSAMDSSPPLGAQPEDYLNWLQQVMTLIETELSEIPTQLENLTGEYNDLATEYNQIADTTLSLSGNLEVQNLKSNRLDVYQLRPTGALIIIGGVLGLLIYGVILIIQISRRTG